MHEQPASLPPEMASRISYLQVRLPPNLRSTLHILSLALQQHVVERGGSFDAMNEDDLHMTILFTGDSFLPKLPRDTLVKWHASVAEAVSSISVSDDALTALRVEGLALFPPGKENLVVALFLASPALHTLHASLRSLLPPELQARNHGSRSQCWVPHVTLGKLRGSALQTAPLGRSAIFFFNQIFRSLLSEPIAVAGLDIGGDPPKQALLDWSLSFAQPPAHATNDDADEAADAHSIVPMMRDVLGIRAEGCAAILRSGVTSVEQLKAAQIESLEAAGVKVRPREKVARFQQEGGLAIADE